MPARRSIRLSVLAAFAALAVAAAGCGGGGATGTASTASTATTAGAAAGTMPAAAPAANAGTTDEVAIKDFKYGPDAITVKAGTTVSWTNQDAAPHTATADDGSFDSGTIKQGETKTAVLTKAGTHTYICSFHPFMKATVIVR